MLVTHRNRSTLASDFYLIYAPVALARLHNVVLSLLAVGVSTLWLPS